MSVSVVGSIAFDTVETPFGRSERELGGSAVHASLAAAFFTDVRVVGPVGEDFTTETYEPLHRAGVVTEEIARLPGETFSWRGHYDFDLSTAHTDETALNVFEDWRPRLAPASREADILFLAAMDPETQLDVRRQWQGSRWVALDTMGYWIQNKREALTAVIEHVDFVLMNDQEARALTGERQLLKAAREIMLWGPRAVVLKLGEYGCALLHGEEYFSLPGYPLEEAMDPTGTGDAFAGGFLGYLDLVASDRLTTEVLRQATTYGATMASFCVEDFGSRRLLELSKHEVDYRVTDFRRMTHFEHVPTEPRPLTPDEPGSGRFARPDPTPSTTGWDAPAPTAATPSYRSPGRTPSTETFHAPRRPLPREDA